MRAIEITASGVLALCERDIPKPAEGEVLIKVAACGLNRADLLQVKGMHPPPAGASDLPGLEVSGVIVETGGNVSPAMKGERVCALLEGGGYAEYATAKVTQCLPVPEPYDLLSSAAFPEALFTVTKNVFILGGLRPDEHVLIHGGASGIGVMAIQMAKQVGAFVSITAGTDEKCALCEELGADHVINYNTQKFEYEFDQDPIDVVLDMVGGDYIQKSLSIMAHGGRHVSIAYLNGKIASVDLSRIMQRNLTMTGSTLRHDSDDNKSNYAEMIRDIFWPEVISGTIKPVIHTTYRLEEAQKAHEAFAKGLHAGKILLKL